MGVGKDQGDVVVIDEGHEGVVLGHGVHGLTHQVNEARLVGDVVDRGVDGDDNLAQLCALIIKLSNKFKVNTLWSLKLFVMYENCSTVFSS